MRTIARTRGVLVIPHIRIRAVNDAPLRTGADAAWVVYWMIGARRTTHNFALDHAVDLAREHKKPLVILEPLRAGYPWANDRHHTFCIEGMRDNARACADAGVAYHAYVEPTPGAGRGLLAAYAARAVCVVTDDVPGFFLPRMVASAGAQLAGVQIAGAQRAGAHDVTADDARDDTRATPADTQGSRGTRVVAVDSNGLYPLRATDKVFPTAYAFRRHLQNELPPHLAQRPRAEPLDTKLARAPLPNDILARWPALALDDDDPLAIAREVAGLPIDHTVAPAAMRGGARAGRERARAFLADTLARYGERRSDPDADAQSGLSPYLHWGHVSAHDVFEQLVRHESWTPAKAGGVTNGSKEGFWGMSASAESFLDEIVTWRELGFHFAAKRADFAAFDSLPEWALASLAQHGKDKRAHVYTLDQLAAARTHDDVWNAAQRQLVQTGIIHNYLRMLWGKKVLEWSRTPREAFDTLVELNNKYAVDGRDPNSSSGIAWTFGRFDRPWPERSIFGVIRYMSSENTKKKLDMKRYLARFGSAPSLF